MRKQSIHQFVRAEVLLPPEKVWRTCHIGYYRSSTRDDQGQFDSAWYRSDSFVFSDVTTLDISHVSYSFAFDRLFPHVFWSHFCESDNEVVEAKFLVKVIRPEINGEVKQSQSFPLRLGEVIAVEIDKQRLCISSRPCYPEDKRAIHPFIVSSPSSDRHVSNKRDRIDRHS